MIKTIVKRRMLKEHDFLYDFKWNRCINDIFDYVGRQSSATQTLLIWVYYELCNV